MPSEGSSVQEDVKRDINAAINSPTRFFYGRFRHYLIGHAAVPGSFWPAADVFLRYRHAPLLILVARNLFTNPRENLRDFALAADRFDGNYDSASKYRNCCNFVKRNRATVNFGLF